MKCEDIRMHLEPMLRGELNPEQEREIMQHLGRCPGCAREHKELQVIIAQVGASNTMSKAPDYLEDRIRRRFKQRYQRRLNVPKAAVAALAILTVFTTVYAQAATGFLTNLDILDLFTHGDQGLENSLRVGAGQLIDEHITIDNVTVNLHSLIADGNRTAALFSVEGPRDANLARLESLRITDKDGKVLEHRSGYTYTDGKLTGKIETVSADQLSTVKIEFKGISFSCNYALKNLPLDVTGPFPQTIVFGDGAGEIIIEGIVISANKLTMEFSTRFPDSQSQFPMLNLHQDGELLRNGHAKMAGNRGEFTWTLVSDSPVVMDLEYRATLASLTEPVTFQVKVDKKKAEQHTVHHDLDMEVELEEGVTLGFSKIVASASQSVLEFSVKTADPARALLPDAIKMTLLAEGEPISFQQSCQDGKHQIKFDPTVPLDNLALVIHGYYLVRDGADQYELSLADLGSTIDFHGASLLIEEIDVDNRGLIRFRLNTVDKPVLINSAALIQGDKETEPLNLSYWKPVLNEEMHRFDITFAADEREQWILKLGPAWQEYRQSSLTIEIP